MDGDFKNCGAVHDIPDSNNDTLALRMEQIKPTKLSVLWLDAQIREIYPGIVNVQWYIDLIHEIEQNNLDAGIEILEHQKTLLKEHGINRIFNEKRDTIPTPLHPNRFGVPTPDHSNAHTFTDMIMAGNIDAGIHILTQHGISVTDDEHQQLDLYSTAHRENKCLERAFAFCTEGESPIDSFESEFENISFYFDDWNKEFQNIFLCDSEVIRIMLCLLRETVHKDCIVDEDNISPIILEWWKFYLDQIGRVFLEETSLMEAQLPLTLDIVNKTGLAKSIASL